MFLEIPNKRPQTPLLDAIDNPGALSKLPQTKLAALAQELRAYLLYSVGQTGGHFGAGLGVIELTIALHYLLDTPADHLIWDVGHQCYPHKILTERQQQMLSIRQKGGLSPFPKRSESPYDDFGTGHSSTSISAALGMAIADQLQGLKHKTVAVIGDGAMTAGMAFEALNHAAHTDANLLVVLNDNEMSISHNVGGLATYLSKNLKSKTDGETTAALFEALDFQYSGPIDGNDLTTLLPALNAALNRPGPQFLHIVTRKGKGFKPAEQDPVGYHALTKIEPTEQVTRPKKAKFCNIFGHWLCDMAKENPELIGITPAMREGSDMVAFSEQYPNRFFDVAIAEQHALTLAAGMACRNMKPVVAIYSTFLQRAYDQLVHDITIQNLDLLLAVDRAGLVGEDGATHAGCFDISMLRCLPGMVIMTPSDEQELYDLLSTGYHYPGPAAVRYPRGSGTGISVEHHPRKLALGRSRTIRQGRSAAILNFGPLLPGAQNAAETLDLTLIDMRFVKPLDTQVIYALAKEHDLLVTVEDHSIAGGAGSAVGEYLLQEGLKIPLLSLGIPDTWIEHATRQEQLSECGLDTAGIIDAVQEKLRNL